MADVGASQGKILRLDGQHLAIQPESTLLIQSKGLGKGIKAKFIGMERGKYLIVRLPPATMSQAPLMDSEEVTVRFLGKNGAIHGFQSFVGERVTRPVPLLFLGFPKTIEVLSLRRHDRAFCYLPTSFFIEGNDFAGTIVDISQGGCRIVPELSTENGAEAGMDDVPDAIKDGVQVFCTFTMSADAEPVHVNGTIRSVNVEAGKVGLGVSFDEVSEDIKANLSAYVKNVQEALGDAVGG